MADSDELREAIANGLSGYCGISLLGPRWKACADSVESYVRPLLASRDERIEKLEHEACQNRCDADNALAELRSLKEHLSGDKDRAIAELNQEVYLNYHGWNADICEKDQALYELGIAHARIAELEQENQRLKELTDGK